METHHDDRDGTMVVTAYAVEEGAVAICVGICL